MDPVTLGILASIATILTLLYAVVFGGRGLADFLERRRRAKSRNLKLQQLYLQFTADPRVGYAQYMQFSNEALMDYEAGFDRQLREELLRLYSQHSEELSTEGVSRELLDYDGTVRLVKRYLRLGRYENALRLAEGTKSIQAGLDQLDTPEFGRARAELDVYHAEALMYTGRLAEAIALLKDVIATLEGDQAPEDLAKRDALSFDGWRRNSTLGRAHNDLGYAYWMELGYYRSALKELRSALSYYLASKLEEEFANTRDNMGRVYGLLGRRAPAELMIEDALQERRRLGHAYRYALSLNSLAITHLIFEEPYRAQRLSEESLNIVRNLRAQRGIGLASITLGRSLVLLSTFWRVDPRHTQARKYLDDAIGVLQEAVGIFRSSVDEPVRLIEAYNALGRAHRERALLERNVENGSVQEAEQNFSKSLDLADARNPVLYIDGCIELAWTYLLRKEFGKTEEWIQRAEIRIPDRYKVSSPAGLREVPEEDCIEAFWQYMGKVELLHGHLAHDIHSSGDRRLSRQVMDSSMQHYVLAAAYYSHYSGEITHPTSTIRQLYDRFRHYTADDLKHARDFVLPGVASQYGLDASRLHGFFEDAIQLALQVSR